MSELSGLLRHLRRIYFVIFRKSYIEESIRNRKGRCSMCGCCISRILPCKWFQKDSGICTLWKERGFEALPYHCRIYPFDEADKSDFSRKHCTYSWDIREEPGPSSESWSKPGE